MLRKVGIFAILATVAMFIKIPEAHATQQCYSCVFDISQMYQCVPDTFGYGYGCFTTGDVQCTFAGVCGGNRTLGDGSSYALAGNGRSDHPVHLTRVRRNVTMDFVLHRGVVTRGCGGAIIDRAYGEHVQVSLRALTRDIVV